MQNFFKCDELNMGVLIDCKQLYSRRQLFTEVLGYLAD